MPDEEKRGIGLLTAGAMIVVALIFDILQGFVSLWNALPVLGSLVAIPLAWCISGIAFVIFFLWFWAEDAGVGYLDRNASVKIVIRAAMFVTELIPLINALPAITLGVIALIIVSNPDRAAFLTRVSMKRQQKMSVEQKLQARIATGERIRKDEESQAAQLVIRTQPKKPRQSREFDARPKSRAEYDQELTRGVREAA